MWQNNTSFNSEFPLQFAWDSTSYGLFKTCPYKYYLSQVLGWSSKRKSVHLIFGIVMHDAIERYHKLRAEGIDQDEAMNTVLFALYYRQLLTPEERDRGGAYHEHKIPDGVPAKTSITLLRTFIWYIDQFGDNDAATVHILSSGKPAVELSFTFDLGGGFQYCGHFDQISEYNDSLWVRDYKTTTSVLNARYFEQYTPDIQMTGYTIASQIVFDVPAKGVIVDAMQLGVTFTDFARQTLTRTSSQLEEFLEDITLDLQVAAFYAEKFSWPMNPKACTHFGGCEFHKVCSHSPSVRENFLKADFTKRIWDPLKER